ncbi:uncharacterized protein LOC110685682 [Chenopodium quinoa]|uniref:uncharacterized protein LOC110685682 n=1 Tax=Chenopodium quinoa TaxID=63459 RepID=UPI000B77A859|nr:uncharacterized protein LOC110685682 [Chenopodium quinoa]
MRLPSCLFFCTNCYILSLPPTFSGFPFLTCLNLFMHTRLANPSNTKAVEILISSCPRLQSFKLNAFRVEDLVIRAPELQELIVQGIFDNLLRIEGTANIGTLDLRVSCVLENDLGEWKQVCNTRSPDLPAIKFERLKVLELLHAKMRVHCCCELLRINESSTFPSLKHVEIETLGIHNDLEVIKYLLASSPALEKMTVVLYSSPWPSGYESEFKLNLAKKLMHFGRPQQQRSFSRCNNTFVCYGATSDMNQQAALQESNDIISNLPRQITECILMRLPYHHAVQTSILSRYWRCKWVMLPHIILDQKFYEYVLKRFKNRTFEASQAYSDIISNILLRHIGPIDKFVLCIPSWFPLKKADLSQWLQFVARHGIKEFTLANIHHVRSPKLPSCLYSFENLRMLAFYNCHDLNLPPTFKAFPHLKFMDLDLYFTKLLGPLEAQMLENLIFLCSWLEHLKLIEIMTNLTICAPNLQELVVKGILSTSLSLRETRNIKVIAMDVVLFKDVGLKRSMNEFFGSLLSCQKLVLDKQFHLPMLGCHVFCDLAPPKKLGKELEALITLRILEVPLNCNYAVHFILCLLRSSPNLQRLFIDHMGFSSESFLVQLDYATFMIMDVWFH